MQIFLLIIAPILITIIGSIVQSYLFSSSKEEVSKYKDYNRTKYPKKIFLFFLIWFICCSVIFIVLGIVLFITQSFVELSQWVAFTISALFFMSISLAGLINAVTSFELIENDRIIVARWNKRRDVFFDDIKNYSFYFNQLTIFNQDDKPILFVGDNRLGVNNLIDSLEKHGKYKK